MDFTLIPVLDNPFYIAVIIFRKKHFFLFLGTSFCIYDQPVDNVVFRELVRNIFRKLMLSSFSGIVLKRAIHQLSIVI